MNKKEKDKFKKINLLVLYRNYLFALQERRDYGDCFGDSEDLIEMYEDELERNHVKKLRKRNNYPKRVL